MLGYVGDRARRKKRNTIIFFVLLIVLALGFYIIPVYRLNETIPPEALLPSDEEIISVQANTTIEELELKVFDKEQKIIFRNKQIEKLKTELKILANENEELSKTILDLNNQITLSTNQTGEVESVNAKIKKIKQDSKNELKKLNVIIKDINNEKNVLIKTKNKTDSENNLLKKEYKSAVSKNLKLNFF
jgi:chromosome segregation ATPase